MSSSPSPQEKFSSAGQRYPQQYQSYDTNQSYTDQFRISYQLNPPIYNPSSRAFRAQLAARATPQTYNQDQGLVCLGNALLLLTYLPIIAPVHPPFGSQRTQYHIRTTESQYMQSHTPGPSHCENTMIHNPEQAVQSQGYQPRNSQKLSLRPVSNLRERNPYVHCVKISCDLNSGYVPRPIQVWGV